MKSFDTEIKKYTNKVRLKASERNELRERVLTYMEYHPLPKQPMKEVVESIESQPFIAVHFNAFYAKIVAASMVFVIVAVPFAAERAVPGDVLYPIKTQVNEGIRQQLANSPYEKVVLETQLLERRIAEARLLASEGKLTEEVEASIVETVRGHAGAAQEGLAALRLSDVDEAAIAEVAFDSALAVQSAVLSVETETVATASTSELAMVVRETQADALASKGTTTPSIEGLMARIETETTRAYELFEAIDENATDDERADIERRLEDIERKIVHTQEAEPKEGEEEGAGVAGLLEALSLTQKLIVFMTDIDVSENVALETLVPIVLTPEERIAAVEKRVEEAEAVYAEVQLAVEGVTDEALVEKTEAGLASLNDSLGAVAEALAIQDIDTAEEAVQAAVAMAADLARLTVDIEVEVAPVEEEEVTEPEEVPVEEDVTEPVVEETPVEEEVETEEGSEEVAEETETPIEEETSEESVEVDPEPVPEEEAPEDTVESDEQL